jgi:hypothetical protein
MPIEFTHDVDRHSHEISHDQRTLQASGFRFLSSAMARNSFTMTQVTASSAYIAFTYHPLTLALRCRAHTPLQVPSLAPYYVAKQHNQHTHTHTHTMPCTVSMSPSNVTSRQHTMRRAVSMSPGNIISSSRMSSALCRKTGHILVKEA